MIGIIARHVPAGSQRTAWEDAAKQWRLPYWDWAVKQRYIGDYGLPEIFTKERVPILNFDRTTTTNIINPLWKFSNPTGVPMGHRSMGIYRLRGYPVRNPFLSCRPTELTVSSGVGQWVPVGLGS
jgi:tyrosinase